MAARKYFIRRLPNFLLLHGRRRVDLTPEHQHAVARRPPPSARRWPNLGRNDHWRHCTPRTTPWINVNRVYLLACYRSGSLRHCRHGSSSSLFSTHSRLSMLRSNLGRCASFLREPSLSVQGYFGICGSQTLQFLL